MATYAIGPRGEPSDAALLNGHVVKLPCKNLCLYTEICAALNVGQRSFIYLFFQMANLETHNCSKCWKLVNVSAQLWIQWMESKSTPQKAQGTSQKREQKEYKSEGMRKTGRLASGHDRDVTHKLTKAVVTQIKPPQNQENKKFHHGLGRVSRCPTLVGANGNQWLPKEGKSPVWGIWPLVCCPYTSGWPHIHMHKRVLNPLQH